jgi:tricorn protease
MRSAGMRAAAFVVAAALMAAAALPATADEARLLRHPHIMGDRVAFVYAGDIWTVSVEGGRARRVTSFPEGLEVFPKISPDGKWIAFSGEYAGTRQVYVMPYEGGVPKRLTYYPDVGPMPPRGGYDYMILDWTPDGKYILVRANRTPFGRRVGSYILVDPANPGIEKKLQIPEGGPASFSPDGKKLAYNIKSREFRTWKRYIAGRAQDVFTYDLETDKAEKITEWEGTDNFPMWVGDAIYFASDRDKNWKLNLWRFDSGTGKFDRVTAFEEFDVLFPSRGGDRIIFENGGYLYWLDTANGETKKIDITLGSDKPFTRTVYSAVSGSVGSYSISPSGARAVFGARGDIFTVPAEHGIPRNITMTPSFRERDVEWSPDGKWIASLSEESGEYELWIYPQDGKGEAKQITKGADSWMMTPKWSPDSRKIAITDKKHILWIVDVDSGKKKKADQSEMRGFGSYSFSPGSDWLCYTKVDDNWMSSVWVHSLESGKNMQLTGGFTNDRNPVFSKDGKYIYFVSRRDFVYMEREWQDRLYIGTLSADTPNPLEPLSDEETPASDDKEEAGDKDKKDKKKDDDEKESEKEKTGIAKIDAGGFDSRVVALSEKPKRYYALTAVDGGLAYIVREETGDTELKKFDLESRESKSIMKNLRAYQISADGKKFIFSPKNGGGYGIASFSPGQKSSEGKLDLSGMKMRIDPTVEWKQVYHDAWRIMRDWFYDPDMHGVDWKAMHDRYAVLLPYVAHRTDLDYILGELIGELNAGHTYVFPGRFPAVDRVSVGLLGCRFEADGNRWKIAKIYGGANWHDNERSPLTEPGLNVKEGSYLLAIDGNELTTDESPYIYLENKVGIPVTLKIGDKPDMKSAREISVRPIDSELNLFYMDWVDENRRLVDKLSGGRIGYMHVPNTWYDGYRAFFSSFQPLMDKEALIIDERYNGGGHSPYEMVEIMSRRPFSYWAARNSRMTATPFIVNDGPKAMLINGLSSSGGDAFPFYFREAGLGPLIGEKTWGGLIGYGFSPGFVDGGRFAVPGFAFVNAKGEWDVEAVGVDPDIYCWDDPGLIQAGKEPMIEKAVEYLLEEMKKNPKTKVKKPKGPDRSP